MSNIPKISILVPCFNVEQFVAECLQSLQRQTLTDIEVLCLNDGSTDNTLEIIKQTVGNDPRFHIIDKPNSGYGATMNLGLKMAKANYIGIVESDDYVEPEMFKLLYDQAIEHNLDISRCIFNTLFNGKSIPTTCPNIPKNKTFDPKICTDFFHNPPSIWAAIYRRTLITDNDIQFLETPGAAFQDTSFAFKTALSANRIRCLPIGLLNYRIHQNNSVKKANNVYVVFDELDECVRYANTHNEEEIIQKVILRREYNIFKWNYFRLPPEAAHQFFISWSKRWTKNKGYNCHINKNTIKIILYYIAITKFPRFFENYLQRKTKK